MSSHKIVIGDSRKMSELSDKSIHLIVTSPPYWQLKDYGESDQIGYNDSYGEYINHLNLVWNDCFRVLHDGCKLCINIGDQFARSVYYGGYRVMPIRTEIIKFCDECGFDYMGAIIWQKKTSMNTTGGGSVMGSYPFPRNGIVKIDYEFILLFKKPGKAPKVIKERKEDSRMTREEWNEYFSGHWTFAGAKQKGHLAMFPPELPRRLIKMFTFCGETVLDPFLGSGTTSLAAFEENRSSVGYEINSEFLPTIKEKLGWSNETGKAGDTFELVEQKGNLSTEELWKMVLALPYIYNSVKVVRRTVDPKEVRFGQKIDGSDGEEREEYHSVKKVVSPEVLMLENDEKVKLIGVKSILDKEPEAVEFLKKLVKGTKVYLKYDDESQLDKENNLLGYLYLKNRTFVNAHLIKSGYVDVDKSWEYEKKEKFMKLI
jgi:site-specific DNA-methyltransferase (adenine-specific)